MTSLLRFFVLLLLVATASGANEYRKLKSFVCRNPIIDYLLAVVCIALALVLLYLIFCYPVNECKRAPKPSKKDRKKDADLEMQCLGSNDV